MHEYLWEMNDSFAQTHMLEKCCLRQGMETR